MANWIQITGGGGYCFDARKLVGRFDFEKDVAFSLAAINRTGGHMPVFQPGRGWSVAIHSVACQRLAKALGYGREHQYALLTHDMHESIIGDVMTPVARRINYALIEELKEEVQLALEVKLNTPLEYRPLQYRSLVKLIDTAALHEERHFFMAPPCQDWTYPVPQALYTQPMFEIIKDILTDGEHEDGGFNAFMTAYDSLHNNKYIEG